MGGNDSCSSSCTSEGSSSGNIEKRKGGRKRSNVRRHPVFRGVRQRKGSKWVSEVREPHKKTRIWLGTFPTAEMAARAYDVAMLALRGSSALLNFPDSASILLPPNCSSAEDIRTAAVAVAHAHSCHPTTAYSHSDWSLASNTSEPAVIGCSSTQLHENNEESEPINDEVNYPIFMDEEALFNMPGLLHSMAQGLLISPPPMQTQIDPDDQDDYTTLNMNTSLWD